MPRWFILCIGLVACGDDSMAADAEVQRPDASSDALPGSDSGPADDAGTRADRFFPETMWMYQDISDAPTRSDSEAITTWLEDNGGWGLGRLQIDYSIEVLESQGAPLRSFETTDDFFSPDCDEVDVPVPSVGALEGEDGYACESDGDCHLIVVDREQARLYEMWRADIRGDTFNGGCLAVWDMNRTYGPEARGEQCTSADAAGFPIAPLLLYPEEVAAGEVAHAIRFILPNARMRAGTYTHPATHAGGPNADGPAPVYGGRWRLRSDFDMSSLPNEGARTVARAMQRYGMALADGGNVALTAASDRFRDIKWEGLLGPRDLAEIQPSDFEVIDTGADIELTYDCVRVP